MPEREPLSGRISQEDAWSRVMARSVQNGECLRWVGHTNQGYGVVRISNRSVRAHRLAWYAKNGDTPMDLDHLCRNRWCVNPEHLEPVTNRENVLRGEGRTAQNAKKTHCDKGHPLVHRNGVQSAWRHCLVCKRAWERTRVRNRSLAALRGTEGR